MEELTAHFNGIDILRGRTDLEKCPRCGGVLDKWNIPLDSRENPKVAFSLSRDGYWMASKRFREVCDQNGIHGGRFLPLSSGYFVLIPERTIRIDQWLELRRICSICSRYGEILVNGPPRLADGERPPEPLEMVRSDLEYGSLDKRSFSIWVGDNAADILRAARLRGLAFTRHSYRGVNSAV